MAIYTNKNIRSGLESVECLPIPNGNFTFVYARTPERKDTLKQLLNSQEIGQQVVAESTIAGKPVFVTYGDKSSKELLAALHQSGEQLSLAQSEQKFNAWKWRGRFSNIGQTLNLTSAYFKSGGIDGPKIAFAALNFAASFVNSVFGGQKSEDKYQLQHLKRNLNQLVGNRLPEGCEPPDIHDDRNALRQEPEQPKTLGERFTKVMEANSVRLGEIGLRYMASVALAFPVKNWGKAYSSFRRGALAEGFNAARNKDATNFYTGVTYLAGKTIGLFSKVPDPYNPTPPTALDTVREKYLFRLSSLVEAGAAGTLAIGNFKADKNGKRDYIGAAAGVSLTAGLTTRLFAKFGKKEVDMNELYAHATDLLAQAAPAQLPQMLADSAAAIKEHFHGKKTLSYGAVYTKLMTDLYRYHHIALNNVGAEPQVDTTQTTHAESLIKRTGTPAASFSQSLKNAGSGGNFSDKLKAQTHPSSPLLM